MKSDQPPYRRFTPFLILLGLLVVLTALPWFLAHRILSQASATPWVPPGTFLFLALPVPVGLAIAVGYQVVRLLRERRQGHPGTGLKVRIAVFFLLTTLLASLPQAALSLSFIDAATKTWSHQPETAPPPPNLQAADTPGGRVDTVPPAPPAPGLGPWERTSDAYRSLFFTFYVLLALPILLIALLVSFTQSDTLIQPLINLESATRRIAAGDYSARLTDRDPRELAFLADSFNAMTDELASSRAKLLQTEKITAWQEIARRLAHELRNPLTPIRLSAERILRRNRTDPEHLHEIVEPAVGAILTEVVRLDALLKEFAGFARLPAPQKTRVELRPLVDELLATYRAAHPDLEATAEGLARTARVIADPAQLEQVFANLFKNSVEAMGGSGRLTVVSNLVKTGSASYCRVQIHDTGPGIPDDLKAKVFQPYVTTKTEGTGLGLAIVERILFDHQGRVWFESQAGFGTTFFLDLPVEERP